MTLYKRLTPCKTVSVISKHYTTATTTFKREPNTKRKDRAKLNNVYDNKETKREVESEEFKEKFDGFSLESGSKRTLVVVKQFI